MHVAWSLCTRLVVVAALVASPGLPTARAAEPATGAVFEAEFEAGQRQFDAGEHLAAARTWKGAAAKLPPTAELRANRAAIHEYMADAYDRAMLAAEQPEVMREALVVLDEYAAQLAAATPAEAPSPRIEEVRARFGERLREIDAAAQVRDDPEPVTKATPEPSPPRAWRGLAIGGGVALAGGVAMLGMFAVGYSRTSKFEDAFRDPNLGCKLDAMTGPCAEYLDHGESAERVAVAGLVAAPLLIGAGVALLVVAAKRKQASRQAIAPLAGRGLVGAHWSLRF